MPKATSDKMMVNTRRTVLCFKLEAPILMAFFSGRRERMKLVLLPS